MASTILHTIITPSAVIPTNFIQQNKPGTRTPVNFLKFMIFHTESICLTPITTGFLPYISLFGGYFPFIGLPFTSFII